MRNNHRTRLVTPADFDSPWRVKFFRHKKCAFIKCEFCKIASKRGFYNRAAFKRGDDYFMTIRRELP